MDEQTMDRGVGSVEQVAVAGDAGGPGIRETWFVTALEATGALPTSPVP